MINQGTGPLPVNKTEAEGNGDGYILQGNEKMRKLNQKKKKKDQYYIYLLSDKNKWEKVAI